MGLAEILLVACRTQTFTKIEGMKQIYALVDPRTGEIRYIGKGFAAKRYRDHLRDAEGDRRTHKCCWIRELAKVALVPDLLILEDEFTDEVALSASEVRWIAHARQEGWAL